MELSDATEKIPSGTTVDRSRDLPTSSVVFIIVQNVKFTASCGLEFPDFK
jgi:hypothetical protein